MYGHDQGQNKESADCAEQVRCINVYAKQWNSHWTYAEPLA